jgi:PAS domain S-box-containing protein
MCSTHSLDARLESAQRWVPDAARAGSSSCLDPLADALATLRRRLVELQLSKSRGGAPEPARPGIGYVDTDLAGQIIGLNHSAAAILGEDRDHAVGRSLAAMIALPDRRRFGARLCELLENPDTGEWQTRVAPSGSLITISVALSLQPRATGRGAPQALRWEVRDLRSLRRAQSAAFDRAQSAAGPRIRRDLGRSAPAGTPQRAPSYGTKSPNATPGE